MMQTTSILLTLVATMAVLIGVQVRFGAEAAPAEGLTPFGFLMARAYGDPVEHPVMRFIAFKPSDGAKFRETFEKKHGPRGRDLIDSLGSGSYRMSADRNVETKEEIVTGASSKSTLTEKSVKPQKPKKQ